MKKTRRGWNSTLPPSKGPTRKARLKVKGRSRFPKRRNDAYRKWIRTFPCCVFRGASDGSIWHCAEAAECAHVIPKGRGSDDIDNCVPLCRYHHMEQEGRTPLFQEVHKIDLLRLAAEYGRRWREQQGETAA